MADGATRAARLPTGVTLPYLERGEPTGVPLLLVHAWGESLRSFSRVIDLLPRTLRVFAMDQRGHGDADKPETGYSVAEYVADLAAFQEALGLGPCVLAGSSSGGYVVQQFALDHPSRTLGLVLIGAPRSLRVRPSFVDEVERLTDPIDPGWIRSSLEWFPRYHDVPHAFLEARVEDLAKMPARVWKQALSGMLEADVPTESGTITAPTLIIEGALDELLPADVGPALAAAISRSRLVTYESTGHAVLWEQPERIVDDVASFVADIRVDAALTLPD